MSRSGLRTSPTSSAALGARRLFVTECRFFPEFVQDALREIYKYRSASCVALRGGSCFPSRGRRQRASRGCRQLCVSGSREGGPWARASPFLRGDGVLSSSLGGRASIRQGQALLLCIRLDRSLVSVERSTWGSPGGISGAKAG